MKCRKDEFRESAMSIERRIGMGTAYSRTRRQVDRQFGGNPLAIFPLQLVWGYSMVNQCANPTCGKPLHYLREGRIFVFDMPDPNVPVPVPGGRTRHLRHFWLCGVCSETMVMEQTSDMEIQVALKSSKVQVGKLAS
jgi:hypothetical protein